MSVPVKITLPGEDFVKLERIAARRGVTVAQLVEQHVSAGLAPRQRTTGHRLTPAEVALIATLHRDGVPASEIARRVGCTHRAVAYRIERMEGR